MRRRIGLCAMLSAAIVLLTGCWDQVELPKRAFVMGVAIDSAEGGKLRLTSQIYKPMQMAMAGSNPKENAYLNVAIEQRSVFEAVRDITSKLGRRAQWSHQRIILIGDEFARERGVREVIDFFNRDHEPRQTSLVYITEGEAGPYLAESPLIENTTSQLLKRIQESTEENAGKTITTNLLELNIQLHTPSGIARVPYIGLDGGTDLPFDVKGVALLKDGKLSAAISPSRAEALQLLMNTYQYGILSIPCEGDGKSIDPFQESIEVLDMNARTNVSASPEAVDVNVSLRIKGSVSELYCSDITTIEGETKFRERTEAAVTKSLSALVESLQESRIDALGIADRIYRRDPALWKKLKPTWEERFQQARFTFNVELSLTDTGMIVGRPE